MFERYTESARRALFFARYETSQLGGAAIETEHLLLGLLRNVGGLAPHLLAGTALSYESALREIGAAETGTKLSTSVEIPFSQQTKQALHGAVNEANVLKHTYIGTEHLLLGLLTVKGSVACSILERHGMSLERARDDILRRLGELASQSNSEDGSAPSEETDPSRMIYESVTRVEQMLGQLVAGLDSTSQTFETLQAINEELENLKRTYGRPLQS